MCLIRLATAADARVLAELASATFREAFAADFPAHDVELYCAEAFSEGAQAREIADPAMMSLLVEHDGTAVAYAQLRRGAAPVGVAPLPALQLKRIYVLRQWHGTGLATALLRRVAELARTDGARSLWLAVWQRNARAIRFYERSGFAVVGAMDFVLGTDRQRDHVMSATVDALLAPGPVSTSTEAG